MGSNVEKRVSHLWLKCQVGLEKKPSCVNNSKVYSSSFRMSVAYTNPLLALIMLLTQCVFTNTFTRCVCQMITSGHQSSNMTWCMTRHGELKQLALKPFDLWWTLVRLKRTTVWNKKMFTEGINNGLQQVFDIEYQQNTGRNKACPWIISHALHRFKVKELASETCFFPCVALQKPFTLIVLAALLNVCGSMKKPAGQVRDQGRLIGLNQT